MPKHYAEISDELLRDPAILLDHLRAINHPARLDELLRGLGLSRHDKKALLLALDELAERGDVLRLAGGRWLYGGHIRRVRGVLSVLKSGAGFVKPEAEPSPKNTAQPKEKHRTRSEHLVQPDIFIRAESQAGAWDGDTVEVALLPGHGKRHERSSSPASPSSGGQRGPEGRVLRIISRGRAELIVETTRRVTPRGVLAKSADIRISCMFDVDLAPLAERPPVGSLLRVRLDAEPDQPEGGQVEPGLYLATAIATLGCEQDAAVQERLVKINHQIPMEFPAAVLAEAQALQSTRLSGQMSGQGLPQLSGQGLPQLSDSQGLPPLAPPVGHDAPRTPPTDREDQRHLDYVTIDGADARDFDDAICVVITATGYRLHVAIADVSWYVRPGSALDREARERGNSCYFPLSVEPMLPEALSNDLCSLRPDVERFVLTAAMDISTTGEVTAAHFAPAVIRSRARLTYDGVQAELDRNGDEGSASTIAPNLCTMLHTAAKLAKMLRTVRMERGALDMDLPEPAYDVDANGRVIAIRKARSLFAHHLIEEFMLCANEAVARFLSAKGVPFPCRIHPEPDPDRLDALFQTLSTSSLSPELLSKLPARPDASAIKTLLDAARGTPQAFVVNRLVLRAMMQARYAPELAGHFGLASASYCHFTSPIRRYADLIVHRALRHALGYGVGPVPARFKLLAIADQCNVRERAAQDAEREMTRRMACLLLHEREGEVFEGVIASVIDFGLFVELAYMPVEGMVRVATLDDDWYAYDPEHQELAGVGTGRTFRVGQAVTVRLERADLGRLEIDLSLIRAEVDPSAPRRGHRHPSAHTQRPRSAAHAHHTNKEGRHAPQRKRNHGTGSHRKRSGRG